MAARRRRLTDGDRAGGQHRPRSRCPSAPATSGRRWGARPVGAPRTASRRSRWPPARGRSRRRSSRPCDRPSAAGRQDRPASDGPLIEQDGAPHVHSPCAPAHWRTAPDGTVRGDQGRRPSRWGVRRHGLQRHQPARHRRRRDPEPGSSRPSTGSATSAANRRGSCARTQPHHGPARLDAAGNPFFVDVARGAERAARDAGLGVMVCNSAQSVAEEAEYLSLFAEQRVRGVLLTPAEATGRTVEQFRRHDIPIRARRPGRRGRHRVLRLRRRRERGALAVRHLVDAGHRKIAYVSGPPPSSQCEGPQAGRAAGARRGRSARHRAARTAHRAPGRGRRPRRGRPPPRPRRPAHRRLLRQAVPARSRRLQALYAAGVPRVPRTSRSSATTTSSSPPRGRPARAHLRAPAPASPWALSPPTSSWRDRRRRPRQPPRAPPRRAPARKLVVRERQPGPALTPAAAMC